MFNSNTGTCIKLYSVHLQRILKTQSKQYKSNELLNFIVPEMLSIYEIVTALHHNVIIIFLTLFIMYYRKGHN